MYFVEQYLLEELNKMCIVEHVFKHGTMQDYENNIRRNDKPVNIITNIVLDTNGDDVIWEYDLIRCGSQRIRDAIIKIITSDVESELVLKLHL